ncbi:hypothetical protein [Corallococcus macrosporus]|uniref:Uncharacterized protein n=1 Tax=Myxococcus fulvus (strain ATCC BAA-855 / HW-1) TaxID=483219 RepID=F8CG79_MYXFH|nr:hypothetical protein [Corallococcus macrosporus]AEI67431.1 hypothetical protein LILAB_27720 [Corallococcus macrosporus]
MSDSAPLFLLNNTGMMIIKGTVSHSGSPFSKSDTWKVNGLLEPGCLQQLGNVSFGSLADYWWVDVQLVDSSHVQIFARECTLASRVDTGFNCVLSVSKYYVNCVFPSGLCYFSTMSLGQAPDGDSPGKLQRGDCGCSKHGGGGPRGPE